MKKHKFGKRMLACAVSAATLLTGTTTLSALTSVGDATLSASASDYDNYAKLLQYSLYFYDANWCGDATDGSAVEWRDDCHTDDAVVGGFHDAGDHVKFGLPAGYSASTLGWSYYEYSEVFDELGQTNHLQKITDHFAEYFKNCTTLSSGSVTNFIYQVGDGTEDHKYWCAPEADPATRTVYSTTNSASDIAAEYAAALAVNYINFGNGEDLTYAKALYEFSIQNNTCATEGVSGFYSSYDYYDDQAWAAGWLYLATGDSTYKTFLNTFMTTSGGGSSGSSGCQWGVYTTMNWNNVSAGATVLQAEITGSSSEWEKLVTLLNQNGISTSSTSYYCESAWGSCRYNTAMQMIMLLLNENYNSSAGYDTWAKNQMEIILGNNSINTCFVTGFSDNSAKYAHHRAASGYDSSAEMTGQTGYASDGHTLIGALVGGPTDSNMTYTDSIQDYTCNEVTIDYNATLVGAAAALYALYGTGEIDDEIEGINMDSSSSSTTTSEATTTTEETTTEAATESDAATTSSTTEATTSTTVQTTTTAGNSSSDVTLTPTVQQGQSDAGYNFSYVEFSSNGADSATVYYTVSSSDTESTVCFNLLTGSWDEENQTIAVPSGGSCSAEYTFPSDGTYRFSVYWPASDSVSITSVVLHYGSSSTTSTTTATTTTTTTTSKTTTSKTTTTSTTTTTTAATENGGDNTTTAGTFKGTLCGDVNLDGELSMADVILLAKMSASLVDYNDTQRANGDCNLSGGIDSNDVGLLLKFQVQIIQTLPYTG